MTLLNAHPPLMLRTMGIRLSENISYICYLLYVNLRKIINEHRILQLEDAETETPTIHYHSKTHSGNWAGFIQLNAQDCLWYLCSQLNQKLCQKYTSKLCFNYDSNIS